MTRSVALRLLAFFGLFTMLFALVSIGSHVPLAEALFLISGSLCAVLLLLGLMPQAHASIPARVRRHR
jgi:hypothetical protein